MADTCVLRLLAPDLAEWLVVDSGGARRGDVERGAPAAAARTAAGQRLVVLVPGSEVVVAQPELPARSHAKLLQLAPVALEENLAADIETLHFAIGRAGADRRVPVAAVDRGHLRGWLDALRSAGLEPAALHPDSLVVPANPSHTVVLLDGERLHLRRPGELPVALEADPVETALAVAGLPPADAGAAAATHLIVYASPTDWERAAPAFEALRARIGSLKVQLLPDGPLPVYAASAVTEPPFSLLQGEFGNRDGLAGEWPRWRLAAGLLATFLALHVATLGVDWWRLKRQEKAVDVELRTAAAEALPGLQNLGRVPNLRVAVDNRLRSSRAATGEGLVGTLGALAAAAAQAPGIAIDQLSYREGVTDLTLEAPDVGALDRVQQVVSAQGFQATMQGASQKDKRYEGRLQLRGPGS
jgi:general secretion pathway protein L